MEAKGRLGRETRTQADECPPAAFRRPGRPQSAVSGKVSYTSYALVVPVLGTSLAKRTGRIGTVIDNRQAKGSRIARGV